MNPEVRRRKEAAAASSHVCAPFPLSLTSSQPPPGIRQIHCAISAGSLGIQRLGSPALYGRHVIMHFQNELCKFSGHFLCRATIRRKEFFFYRIISVFCFLSLQTFFPFLICHLCLLLSLFPSYLFSPSPFFSIFYEMFEFSQGCHTI